MITLYNAVIGSVMSAEAGFARLLHSCQAVSSTPQSAVQSHFSRVTTLRPQCRQRRTRSTRLGCCRVYSTGRCRHPQVGHSIPRSTGGLFSVGVFRFIARASRPSIPPAAGRMTGVEPLGVQPAWSRRPAFRHQQPHAAQRSAQIPPVAGHHHAGVPALPTELIDGDGAGSGESGKRRPDDSQAAMSCTYHRRDSGEPNAPRLSSRMRPDGSRRVR